MERWAAVFAAFTAGWLALRRFTLSRPWWIQFLDDLTPILLGPSLPLAVVALIRGEVRSLLLALIPAGVFVANYRSRFRPRSSAPGGGTRLRIMTLNLLCRAGRGGESRLPAAVLDAIRGSGADVVTLQEVLPFFAEAFSGLRDVYPHQALYPGESARGAVLLSRLPILTEERFQLSAEGWYCLEAQLDWHGRPLTLLNIHLRRPEIHWHPEPDWQPFDTRPRSVEMKRLVEHVRGLKGDVIVAGDFNMTDRSEDHDSIRALLRDAFIDAGRGFGFTYPARTRWASFWFERHGPPFLRLDHVFYEGRLRARSARVGPNGDSDHFSLIVDMEGLAS